ncbi:hypothetical protein M9458_007417, partial [Cirrhinus mrigala]
PFPDPHLMAAGAKLHEMQPQPLIALVLDGLSEIELTPSKFGPVPCGSPMSYHCPPETSSDVTLHHLAPELPALPLPLDRAFSNLSFVPTLHQQLHLVFASVSTNASRFREACASWEGNVDPEAAAKALAGQMIRGSKRQTPAMLRGLQMESEVLSNYAKLKQVNAISVGFIIPPGAPHLGASPDGRVYDPSESPPFGLVEVKSTTNHDASQVAHLKSENGSVSLRQSHQYYWQVQGQLAITGLEWCDFVTDTQANVYVERIWRDNEFILFYYNTYINVYLE